MRTKTHLLLLVLVLAVAANAQEPATGAAPSTPKKPLKGTETGHLIHQVSPAYPMEAKSQHIEGTVELSAIIAKDGKLRDIKFVSGPAVFTQSALDALAQWQYEPYRLNGEPVEVETSIKINFVLPVVKALYERPDPVPSPNPENVLPQRIRVSQAVAEALIQKKVTPHYPVDARNGHLQGAVVLAAIRR